MKGCAGMSFVSKEEEFKVRVEVEFFFPFPPLLARTNPPTKKKKKKPLKNRRFRFFSLSHRLVFDSPSSSRGGRSRRRGRSNSDCRCRCHDRRAAGHRGGRRGDGNRRRLSLSSSSIGSRSCRSRLEQQRFLGRSTAECERDDRGPVRRRCELKAQGEHVLR